MLFIAPISVGGPTIFDSSPALAFAGFFGHEVKKTERTVLPMPKFFSRIVRIGIAGAFAIGVIVTTPDQSSSQTTYQIRNTVMGAAGTPLEGGSFRHNGTMGQPVSAGTGEGQNQSCYVGFWRVWINEIRTDVQENPSLYTNQLNQNYPNPFNPSTTITYSVAKPGNVEISVFNVKGQRVRTLVNGIAVPGQYRVEWHGRNDAGQFVASGVYFYRLRAPGYNSVKKMVILK
jgi:hypothetical protein